MHAPSPRGGGGGGGSDGACEWQQARGFPPVSDGRVQFYAVHFISKRTDGRVAAWVASAALGNGARIVSLSPGVYGEYRLLIHLEMSRNWRTEPRFGYRRPRAQLLGEARLFSA